MYNRSQCIYGSCVVCAVLAILGRHEAIQYCITIKFLMHIKQLIFIAAGNKEMSNQACWVFPTMCDGYGSAFCKGE